MLSLMYDILGKLSIFLQKTAVLEKTAVGLASQKVNVANA